MEKLICIFSLHQEDVNYLLNMKSVKFLKNSFLGRSHRSLWMNSNTCFCIIQKSNILKCYLTMSCNSVPVLLTTIKYNYLTNLYKQYMRKIQTQHFKKYYAIIRTFHQAPLIFSLGR